MHKYQPNILKLCLIGDGGVGKTTLTNRILTGIFNPATKMTIGIDFQLFKLDILDPISDPPKKESLDIQIWDFGGQQHFRFMQPRFMEGAVGGLLMFDLTRYSTTQNLGEWLQIWHENCRPGAPLYLVGSKFDRIVETGGEESALETCKEVSEEFNIEKYYITSAKSGYSLDIILDSIAKDMFIYNRNRNL